MSQPLDQPDPFQPDTKSKPQSATGLPPRRKLDKLAWALGAVALGWIAQGLFGIGQLWPGLLLYAVAIPLFASQMASPPPQESKSPPASSGIFNLRDLSGLRGRTGIGAITGAVAMSGLAWLLLGSETHSATGWALYPGSLVLFEFGIWLVEASPSGPEGEQPARQAGSWSRLIAQPDMWLLAILFLALFMRLFHFFSLPFGTWYDEATAGIEARRVLQDPTFRPVFSVAMNQVAHHLYLFTLSTWLLGDNIAALRLVSVLFGIGAVVAAYLFGREYGGRRWGLLLAFLVASMRWHVNFSRIAMNGVDVPFFEFLTMYFALRAVRARPGPLRAMAWLGLAVGLGLCFYTPYRLFLIAGLLFILIMCARSRSVRQCIPAQVTATEQGAGKRYGLATSLGLLLLAIWLAAMPAIQFAWQDSQAFWGRARHVSIFQNREDPNLARALAHNVGKHLLMFNYQGDANGRHNLPGAPTLDRLSAVLFALGLGLAVARHDRSNLFFLCLFVTGLSGGILTLDFEAPQSLRSIGALPAVTYFIALSLDALWSELRWAAHITRPRHSLALVGAGLAAIALSNAYTYFGPQAHDSRVWLEFSTAETLVGKKMAELGPEPVYYLSQFFYDHACIRFHAPPRSPLDTRKVMPLLDPWPAREPPDRPVVYFIHPDEEWIFRLAQQIYPNAWFETLPAGSEHPPAVFVVHLKPDDVASVQGLELSYWPGDNWDGTAETVASHSTVAVSWPADAPLELPFVAEWRGILYAPDYGQYTLKIEAPSYVELTLDGESIEGEGVLSLTTLLAVGNHELRLRVAGGRGQVRLTWQPPGGEEEMVPAWVLYSFPIGANGLLGKYYSNPDWQGTPTLERIDPVLNTYFHLTPLPRPYSVEWTGSLYTPERGLYHLGLRAVDQARLYLDSQLLIEATTPDEYLEAPIELEAGPHKLRITYQDLSARSRMHLFWTLPNGEREIIPAPYLWPGRTSPQLFQPPALPPPTEDFPAMELKWLATWGGAGDMPGRFLEPRDVAVIGDTVFVADTGNQRVQAFNQDGTFQNAWRGAGEAFQEPLALGVDSHKRLLVLDSLEGWIYRFDGNGRPLDRIGGPGLQAYHPRGLTVLKDDTLVVADTGGGRLLFLTPTGDVQRHMGETGKRLSQLSEPVDMAAGEDGIYYVVEAYNQRVQLLNSGGRGLAEWPIPHSIAYDGPHLALASDGSLLLTAPEQAAIQRYAPDGRLLGQWSQAGSTPLCRPVGIYLDDATQRLYVTDTGCHYVYVFEIE